MFKADIVEKNETHYLFNTLFSHKICGLQNHFEKGVNSADYYYYYYYYFILSI